MARYTLRTRPGYTLALEEGGQAYCDGDTLLLAPDRMRALQAQFPTYRFEPVEEPKPSADAPPKKPEAPTS